MHIYMKYPMVINLKSFLKTWFKKYKRIVQELQRAPENIKHIDLYTKMCRIKLKKTFMMNIGLPDLSKKSYLRKTVL